MCTSKAHDDWICTTMMGTEDSMPRGPRVLCRDRYHTWHLSPRRGNKTARLWRDQEEQPRPKRFPSALSLVAPPRERPARDEGRPERGSDALPTERRAGAAGAKPKAVVPAMQATSSTDLNMFLSFTLSGRGLKKKSFRSWVHKQNVLFCRYFERSKIAIMQVI